jgi:hypothetical protein
MPDSVVAEAEVLQSDEAVKPPRPEVVRQQIVVQIYTGE